jgi:amino acid transporter
MTLLSLVAALYFMVSGGPYGLEELAQKVGFAGAIAILLVTPILWSIPTALMVAEFAACLPKEGGYYAWVRRALGPFWGFQEGWLSLAASVFDMAIYPTLFVSYLAQLFPALGAWPIALGATMIGGGAVFNLAGARAVGDGSIGMTVLLLAPFLVLAALACGSIHGTTATNPAASAGPADYTGGVLIAMWNYMGWDNASTIADEVERPQRTYPLAVLSAVALVAITYIVPMGAMWVAKVDPSHWRTGAWVHAGRAFGGSSLAIAVTIGGMVSAFGMFNALCLSYSRLPAALADDGYLPRVLARRLPSNSAPWAAILASSSAWMLSLGLSFERLVCLDVLLYGGSLVLEFVALAVLRLREPELHRPFRIPGSVVVVSAFGVGPVILLGFALLKNVEERVWGLNALAVGGAVVLLGPLVYAILRWSKCAEWTIQGTSKRT